MPSRRDATGRFVRTREIWKPEDWDNGHYDNRGRVRVYRPDYPKAYEGGYALRAHIVWWLQTGKVPPDGFDIHHINKIVDDDRFENLKAVEHGEHSRFHNDLGDVILICECCQKKFAVSVRKFNARKKEGLKIKYCSQKCYQSMPKKIVRIELICGWCKKPFRVTPFRSQFRKFCSKSCSAFYRWRK